MKKYFGAKLISRIEIIIEYRNSSNCNRNHDFIHNSITMFDGMLNTYNIIQYINI